jgi:hypothetical protein
VPHGKYVFSPSAWDLLCRKDADWENDLSNGEPHHPIPANYKQLGKAIPTQTVKRADASRPVNATCHEWYWPQGTSVIGPPKFL